MAVVLGTTLRIGKGEGEPKVVEEGTPFGKLTKAEKELAKELNLLVQVPDEPEEEEDLPEEKQALTESEEEELS